MRFQILRVKKGFTLVELLVVIGIIALLVSLLLPALSKARASAEGIKCLSNLHQLGVAAANYAASNHGVIASSSISGWIGSSPIGVSWDVGPPPNTSSGQDPKYGLWGNCGVVARLLACPALATSGLIQDADSPYVPATNQYFKSYGWNWLEQTFVLGSVRQPASTVLITDVYTLTGSPILIGNGAVYSYHPSFVTAAGETPQVNEPAFHGRHSGKGGVLWVDAHASLETPIYAPAGTVIHVPLSPKTYTAQKMKTLNIGFLCRSLQELNSNLPIMDYYYLINKDVAAAPDFSSYGQPGI